MKKPKQKSKLKKRAMAWKRLRPSAVSTVGKAMYIGALISLITPAIIGTVYILISYLSFKTVMNCEYQPEKSTSVRVQWMRTIADITGAGLIYISFLFTLLFLFRSYQLKGVKRKLLLVCCMFFSSDALYRVFLQTAGKSYYMAPVLPYQVPFYVFFISNICLQLFLLAGHFCIRPRTKVTALICKMALPICFTLIVAFSIISFIYPAYNKQNSEGKLLIALFAPLTGVVVKAVTRICVQRLWNITHPGYSYVLLVPLYFGSAVVFRVLQADLASLQSIAILGIIHGAAEVVERSTMVVIDQVSHLFWKRRPAPWGTFRTPRRERLMADIAIISMLFESTAIVSVNGFLYLYQLIYLQNDAVLKLLRAFAITTAVPLVIEWFFTSLSLAIETRSH